MFVDELVDLLYFHLGEGEKPSGEGTRHAREEFDGMIPDQVSGEPLGLLFAKDFGVPSIASRDLLVIGSFVWGV